MDKPKRKTKRQLAEAAQADLATPADDPPPVLQGYIHPEVRGRGFLCPVAGQITDALWTSPDRPGTCNTCTHCK